MSSFLELQKHARYEELASQLREELERPWTWSGVRALLEALGVTDVYGFFASGWWLPVEALRDRAEVDRLAGIVERAMAEGHFPTRPDGYRWEDLERLGQLCGIRPADVVRRLLWNYALTPGEEVFLTTFRRQAAEAAGPTGGTA